LACVVIPWTAWLLWRIRSVFCRKVQQSKMEARAREPRKRQREKTPAVSKDHGSDEEQPQVQLSNFTLGFYFRALVLIALWVWLVAVGRQYRAAVAQNKLYEGFDPYDILGVDKSTKSAELNKVYRREAFKYHPDKNSAPEAVQKFLLVRKAYDALTDPETMDNFKKFGNPDGPQYVQLFAFASFIKDKEASRVDGKLRYKPVYFRYADIQVQALAIVVSLLSLVFFASVA